ncbi:uncharacterized protein [Clytia hemisphaerica]
MLKKIWNTDEAVGIIICCIDRFYITDGDLKTLKSGKQLNDQVIDAYICQLTKNLPVEDGIQHIQSHKLTKLFNKGTITFGVKEKKSLQSSKMIVGAFNINSHWMFLVIYPALKEVKLYNSLGLGHSAGVETDILQKWRVACKILDLDGSWKISSQISAMQEDTVSCGAFCLSFAESVVLGEPVKKALSKRDVADFRLKIGHAIIEKSGGGLWCHKTCRICRADKQENLVRCLKCIPERYYHKKCLIKTRERLAKARERLVTAQEMQSLKEGEVLLRKRIDLKVKVCHGCNGSIASGPLRPPHDICIARKEKRKKSGASLTNSNSFVLTNVHYHPRRSCINVNPSFLKISKAIKLDQTYTTFLKENGIFG